jgi:TonB family protein
MKSRPLSLAPLSLALLALALAAAPAVAKDAFPTQVSLLIGFPDEDASGARAALVVPGTVLPVPVTAAAPVGLVEKEEEATARLVKVAEGLRKTLRLSTLDVSYRLPLSLEVDALRDLPPPTSSSDVRLSIKLLGYDENTASYEVQFFERSTMIADTRVAAVRGQQAVVGGLNGAEAPYLFLVVEPAPAEPSKPGPLKVEGDVTPPRAVHKTQPQYPPEAKQAGTEGVVVLRTTIDERGVVVDVQVLRGAPDGLTEAAVEAVRQWRFEPALLDGKPVSVFYNLTINFRLPDKKEE